MIKSKTYRDLHGKLIPDSRFGGITMETHYIHKNCGVRLVQQEYIGRCSSVWINECPKCER